MRVYSQVQALISRREEWCRVKDVLQTQGSLTLEQSLVSLLEEADLRASGQLAFDFVMATSEYGVDGRPGWDEEINSRWFLAVQYAVPVVVAARA